MFVWVWDSFCSSCVVNCTTVLDTFWTRKITSDRKCCNKECCLVPACLSFLLMINHNSVLNYSGCCSAWQVTEVTVFKLANPQHGSSTGYISKGQCKDSLQKDRMVRVGWYLRRSSSHFSAQKAELTRRGCSELCLSLRMETSQFLWTICSSAQSVQMKGFFFPSSVQTEFPTFHFV